MNLKILKFVSATQMDFVSFWSSQYQYDLEHLYDGNIGQPLTEDRVWSLYKWKNGTENIAAKKQESIQNVYLPQLKSLPTLSTIEDGKKYMKSLLGGAIWDIFWLHCVNPGVFPIFDQHTYRSMAHIDGLTPKEIPEKGVKWKMNGEQRRQPDLGNSSCFESLASTAAYADPCN
jgi:hypothetical protein